MCKPSGEAQQNGYDGTEKNGRQAEVEPGGFVH